MYRAVIWKQYIFCLLSLLIPPLNQIGLPFPGSTLYRDWKKWKFPKQRSLRKYALFRIIWVYSICSSSYCAYLLIIWSILEYSSVNLPGRKSGLLQHGSNPCLCSKWFEIWIFLNQRWRNIKTELLALQTWVWLETARVKLQEIHIFRAKDEEN